MGPVTAATVAISAVTKTVLTGLAILNENGSSVAAARAVHRGAGGQVHFGTRVRTG